MRSVVHRRGPATVSANLTPMIDMTFLLIVFFVLVSQITDRQRVPLDLPAPRDPATMRPRDELRTVINVVPPVSRDGSAAWLRIGGTDLPADADGVAAVGREIARLYRTTPGMRLDLRADRTIEYRHVEPVMQAIVEAAAAANVLPRVNLVVSTDDRP